MLEDLFETMCEMIFEGIFDKEKPQKALVWIRIVMITVVAAVLLFFFVTGMKEQNDNLMVWTLLFLFMMVVAFISTYNKYKK
ncbi:MAG: hypothetical protein IJN84_01100 [Clostridia bacterium]|nr:hypothetical protein [Clostridia bacterium]